MSPSPRVSTRRRLARDHFEEGITVNHERTPGEPLDPRWLFAGDPRAGMRGWQAREREVCLRRWQRSLLDPPVEDSEGGRDEVAPYYFVGPLVEVQGLLGDYSVVRASDDDDVGAPALVGAR